MTLSCALSRDSRRTQPGSYASSRDTEYLENSCVPSEELSCEYKRTENAYPRYLDTIVTRYETNISALHTNIFSIPSSSGCLTRSPARSSAPSSRTSRVGASHSTPGKTKGPTISVYLQIFSPARVSVSSPAMTRPLPAAARCRAAPARTTSSGAATRCSAPWRRPRTSSWTPGSGPPRVLLSTTSNQDTVTFDLMCRRGSDWQQPGPADCPAGDTLQDWEAAVREDNR